MPVVSVCICTFRRDYLVTTLESVVDQVIPADLRVQIVVADNDRIASAKAMVAGVKLPPGFVMAYVHAPYNNISVARNACLDRAEGMLIAFLDDDEVADPRWLQHMIRHLEQSGADVVFGPVRAVYPPGAPGWLVRSSPHSLRPPLRHGVVVTGYSANVLIRRSAIRESRFNLDYGKTGGEDTDFFNQMHRSGAALSICEDGLVREEVVPGRLSLRWLLRRAYRSGHSHARSVLRQGKCRLFFLAGGKIMIFGALTGLSLWSDRRWRAYLQRAALHVGVLCWALGRDTPSLYKAVD